MTLLNLKNKLKNDLNNLPLNALKEVEALVNKRLEDNNKELGKNRRFGALPGMVQYMASDFNAPLEEFGEYQP